MRVSLPANRVRVGRHTNFYITVLRQHDDIWAQSGQRKALIAKEADPLQHLPTRSAAVQGMLVLDLPAE